ncbi:MAG: HisA/HisF-related TIM barrel protein [Methylococcaceae bacterium]
MDIIPVIDIMAGQVVHARHGRRESYQPLKSPLCRNAQPQNVVEDLLQFYPFQTLYIADLDALMGGAAQTALLGELAEAFPSLRFWVDKGLPDVGMLPEFKACPFTPVIGSESLDDRTVDLLVDRRRDCILSLDYLGGNVLGPASLLERPELWPDRVIFMNLSRVGSGGGPDFAGMQRVLVENLAGRRCIAAGGVRDMSDLVRLKLMGLSAVLLATALHAGAVGAEELQALAAD